MKGAAAEAPDEQLGTPAADVPPPQPPAVSTTGTHDLTAGKVRACVRVRACVWMAACACVCARAGVRAWV